MPIKFIPDGKKFFCYIIVPGINEGDRSDAWKCFAQKFENGIFHTQYINFDKSYSIVTHSD